MAPKHEIPGDFAATRAAFPRVALGCFVLTGLAINGCCADGTAESTARNAEAFSATKAPDGLSAPSPATAQKPPAARVSLSSQDRYIAVFKKGASKATASAQAAAGATEDVATTLGRSYGGAVHRRYRHALDGMAVQLSPDSADALRADPRVEYVVSDTKIFTHDVTWGKDRKDRIDQRQLPLNQVYAAPGSGAGVHAYIIDSGIRASHAEFQGGPGGISRVGAGIDLINHDDDPEDQRGHGTHVAAIVGGA